MTSAIGLYGGICVTTSIYALKDSDVRTFPVSRHRSARLHKKLVRRFGGEFKKVPAIYQTPQGIICHPAVYAQVMEAIR